MHPLIRAFLEWAYSDRFVTFQSAYSLDESVRRLQDRVKPEGLSSLFKEGIIGWVKPRTVRLRRRIPPFPDNSITIFVGRFEKDETGVFLKGRFTTFLLIRLFGTLWLSFAALWTLLAVLVASKMHRDLAPTSQVIVPPLMGVFMCLIGTLFFRFGWKASQKEILKLSSPIQEALSGPSSRRIDATAPR
ncbi:hypothetical protein [Verrucomicrobium sp. GAS474]|uniref:hypothetical protein n=1 Tax=Verrucomicrobium sp. GAS474 TaxID=1882831 RepID=UPI000B8A1974|nr:hypothetical protein [Verrucomicrobium sp. GAS474]